MSPFHQVLPAEQGCRALRKCTQTEHTARPCPAVGFLPFSMRLGGFSPSPPLSCGWVDAVMQTALQELWGLQERVGLHSAPPVWKEVVMNCISALSASPQGQRGRNCNRPPGRKSQSRDTNEVTIVNPPPAPQVAAVWAEMGLLSLRLQLCGQKWGPLPWGASLLVLSHSSSFPCSFSCSCCNPEAFHLAPWKGLNE